MARKSGFHRKLTPRERLTIGLSALTEMNDPLIAEFLGINEGLLRQYRIIALNKLREMCGNKENEEANDKRGECEKSTWRSGFPA
jgi:hypothetical protein